MDKNPYERSQENDYYYYALARRANDFSLISADKENGSLWADGYYEACNYYNDSEFAKKCAKADLIIRKLRKFAVENNKGFKDNDKWIIYMNPTDGELYTCCVVSTLSPFFSSKTIAEKAKNIFEDDLKWYFKEYNEIFKGDF